MTTVYGRIEIDGTLTEQDWALDPERVHSHVGHEIEIVTYAKQNLAIECVSCGLVLTDIDFWEVESPGMFSQQPALTQSWRSKGV